MKTPLLYTYFDQEYYDLEQKHLFARAPKYIGHQLMAPQEYDYRSIDWLNNSKLIYNQGSQHLLIENICRHRQAIMLKGSGNSRNIVCELHSWTYNNAGELIGAPLFAELPSCKNLKVEPLINWQGLLFKSNRDIAADLANLGKFSKYLNFENYQYSNSIVTDYAFNWKTFIEVYAEDYHVDAYHPGLGNFVDCKHLEWNFGARHHFQLVPAKNHLSTAGSKLYQQWSQKVLDVHAGQTPEFGAIWMTYYPNIMVECYPKCIVISVVEPLAAEQCRVVTEFYYPDEILGFDAEYVELHQQVYLETAKEDDEICYRMHTGRKSLYQRGVEDSGPYQLPTEEGLLHFHQFLAHEMPVLDEHEALPILHPGSPGLYHDQGVTLY